MGDELYIAVDLGAGSGRVFLCGVAPGELLLEEVRRFRYPPAEAGGHLRWNLPEIFEEIKAGLRDAGARARELGRPVRGVGVDSWGVDYGLIDDAGRLVENPVCYRDARTRGAMEEVFARVPRAEVFARTGVQFLDFNTLFQLHAHAREGLPLAAARLLLIPDLINFFLTGRAASEYTNATTTQLVNAETGAWDYELLERLELPSRLLAEIVPAGAELGPVREDLADELMLEGVRVVAPATHDTGSAVAGAPLREGWAYVSSGTWSLVGVERGGALINGEVARQNFTNEGGAYNTIRFLKNVMGLWLLESCRREWQARGLRVDYETLLGEVEAAASSDAASADSDALIFPDDPRLFNPPGMLGALAEQLSEVGARAPEEPRAVARMILDSLALRYASVLRTIERLTGEKIKGVQIVGGGSLNGHLNQATADATGLAVLAGPSESTVVGNLLVQAITAGRFTSLAEARRHVAQNVKLEEFTPRRTREWAEAARRYAEIEARFMN
jgi:rhamnulokinase